MMDRSTMLASAKILGRLYACLMQDSDPDQAMRDCVKAIPRHWREIRAMQDYLRPRSE